MPVNIHIYMDYESEGDQGRYGGDEGEGWLEKGGCPKMSKVALKWLPWH